MRNLKAKKRNVQLGEGVTLVRDMFVADTMEEAKEKAGGAYGKLYEVGVPLARSGKPYGSERRIP